MNRDEEIKKVYEILQDLNDTETMEIELTVAVFKKSISLCVEKYVEFLENEFDQACNNYNKDSNELKELKDEIIAGYKKEFFKIKDRIEERFINLILKLQEIQSSEKMIITKFEKLVQDVSMDDINLIKSYVDVYNNYNGLEQECYNMINECITSIPFLIKSVMKFESEELAVREKVGLFQKIKILLGNLFKSNKFERDFINVKRERIKRLIETTNTVAEDIRNNTVSNMQELVTYQTAFEKTISSEVI